MTTAAKFRKNRQSGQSFIEFALLVPIVAGLLVTLIQIEKAISAAIVNQKYARAQLNFLMFNSRHYPEATFLKSKDGRYMRRFWIGLGSVSTLGLGDGGQVAPVAPTQKVGMGNPPPTDGDPGDVTGRQNVRIRITTFTCVPPVGEDNDTFYSTGNISEDTFTAGKYEYCSNGY